jgi:hypothetical protein
LAQEGIEIRQPEANVDHGQAFLRFLEDEKE